MAHKESKREVHEDKKLKQRPQQNNPHDDKRRPLVSCKVDET